MVNKGRLKKASTLQPGDLIIYPYLWSWQQDQGIEVGEKRRPCVVVMRSEEDKGILLGILPITTQPVRDFTQRMIIPYLERANVGMNPDTPQSIGKGEVNVEWADESSNLNPVERVWSFSLQFSKKMRTEFRENFEAGKARIIMRKFFEPQLNNDLHNETHQYEAGF